MDLYKNFTLGGLFQAGRRMAPPWGAFRRFTNTYKDPTRALKPYGKGLAVTNTPTVPLGNGAAGFTHAGPIASQVYRKGVFQLHAMFNAEFRGVFSYQDANGTNIPVMQAYNLTGALNTVQVNDHLLRRASGNFSTTVVARKSFINALTDDSAFDSTKPMNGFSPIKPWLMSFDGLRPRGAGLPLPWTSVNPAGVPAAHYARIVYATIGMDGELIFSPYLQQRLSSATRDVYVSGYQPYATPRTDVVDDTTFPTYRSPEDHLFNRKKAPSGFDLIGTNSRYFDLRFITTFGPTSLTLGVLSITPATYDPCVAIGDWVMVDVASAFGNTPAHLYMFQVRTLAATITFEKTMKYFDQNSVSWVDADFEVIIASWVAIDPAIQSQFLGVMSDITMSNLFSIISYSNTASAGYRVHGIFPMAWESNRTFPGRILSNTQIFRVPWAGIVSSFMADWYDTTTVKTTFPSLKGVTNYKELLVGFDAVAIYFSDVTLGGSTEMTSGNANLVPYGSEFGDIVAICGSEDFLFVSRERKNYVITGDIASSGFNITECDSAHPGAYNAKCVTNAWAGQVIFLNETGLFSVNSSGKITDISKEIKGLFFHANRDENLFDKTVFKTLTQTRTDLYDGGIFKFFLEDARGFIALLTARVDSGLAVTGANLLVFDTTDGKWYEFDPGATSTAEAIEGRILTLGLSKYLEDGVMRGTEKQLLVTQWMTQDEPSKEKQICQLKFFGEINPATTDGVRSLTIGQQNDWDDFVSANRTGWQTNAIYTPAAYDIYAHKKRFDSSKPQSTSIILESTATGSFEIEGVEIEGMTIQQGVKK